MFDDKTEKRLEWRWLVQEKTRTERDPTLEALTLEELGTLWKCERIQ